MKTTANARLGAGLMGFAIGALLVTPPSAAGQTASREPITFSKHIAPIFQRSCVNCHRPGSIAPMALITYEDVRPYVRAIKRKTALPPHDPDRMPPWFIEKNIGIQQFKDNPSLTDAEIALIGKWVDSGAPQGNPADMPAIDLADRAWSIGTPDLIVSSP